MTDSLITTKDAARVLGIDTRTVTWRARTGKLPYLAKLPGKGTYLFDPDVIDRLSREEPSGRN